MLKTYQRGLFAATCPRSELLTALHMNNFIATFHPLCQRIESDFGNLGGIAIGNSRIARD